jgi:hypothetical protein
LPPAPLSRARRAASAPAHQAIREQQREDSHIEERLAHVAFHLPVEMPHRQSCDHVDEAVQALPAPAQAPHHAVGGGEGQRHQQQQRGEADGDVGALHDIGPHQS